MCRKVSGAGTAGLGQAAFLAVARGSRTHVTQEWRTYLIESGVVDMARSLLDCSSDEDLLYYAPEHGGQTSGLHQEDLQAH